MVESLQLLLNAIVKPKLLKHQDREVKLFVAACICEITRITAPEAPYEDDILKDVFQLIVSTISGLNDVNSPSFGRKIVILETLARYRSCVVMLDLECDDLINEMFDTFFSVARCIKWVQEAFPPGGDCSGLVMIYEQCVRTFWHDERYKDDLRYLKIWLEYDDATENQASARSFGTLSAKQARNQVTVVHEYIISKEFGQKS